MKSTRSSVLLLVLYLHLEVHGEPEAAPMSEVTLTPTETCLSGLIRPGRAPAPAQTLSRCFFRSQEMRKVTRGLRDKLSNRLQVSPSSPVNLSQCLFRSWVERSIILEYFSRPTGTRLSSTAGSTTCTWPASTARRSSGSSRSTLLVMEWAMSTSGAAALTRERRANLSGCQQGNR